MAKRDGGGVRVGGLRIGCGWFVLLLAGGLFALWRWQPGLVRSAGQAVGRAVPAVAGLVKRAAPQATPAPPPSTPIPAPTATPQPVASPTPEPTPAPESGEATPAPSEGEPTETVDLVVGGGRSARLGETVVVKLDGAAQPVAIMLGAGDAPAGLETGLVGMRAGGKRRIAVSGDSRSASFPPGGEPPVGGGKDGAREVELVEVW